MARIAILGASSQIARDLICSLARGGTDELLLYVRDRDACAAWLARHGLSFPVFGYADYGREAHDAVLNFVGVGDPQRAARMGADIFELTREFDELALAGLRAAPGRRYLFLSSGAAYCAPFEQPATRASRAAVPLNDLTPADYYGVAKLYAECRHRALPDLAITDLRVFNYISPTQDLAARFFLTDVLRAVRDGTVLQTGPGYMVRDYLHPDDFHRLVRCVLDAPPANRALDCYSLAPIDKPALLELMQERFGLRYALAEAAGINATGAKPHYYSLDRSAAELGYQPRLTSADGILAASTIIFGNASARSERP